MIIYTNYKMNVLSAKSTNQLTIHLDSIIEKPLLELELSYWEFNNIFMIHEYSDNELIEIMKNADKLKKMQYY